jgi:hypothetical protein
MRRFALLCLLFLASMCSAQVVANYSRSGAAAGGGTFSHIQDCSGAGALVCVFPVNPTQHDVVVLFIGNAAVGGTLTCSDGASNAYTVSVTKGEEVGAGFDGFIAYTLDAPATADKTITCSGLTGYTDIIGSQFRDTGGTPVLDAVYGSPAVSVSDASTAATILPSFTPAVAGSLAFCGILPNSGISAIGSGWTLGVNANSATEYKLAAAASATFSSFTDSGTNDAYVSACIVVKP